MMNWTIMSIMYIFLMNNLAVLALDPIGLRVSGSLRGLPLGSAAGVNNLRQNVDAGQYVSNIKKNYDLIVPETELKPKALWKGDNIYDFTDADWLLGATPNTTGWIQQNGIRLRGHNLLWPRDPYIPPWLLEQESSITPEKAKSLLSDYIRTVVTRYRGKIQWWDVVNEAIDSNNNTNPLNLRNSFWLRKLGADFLKYAFIFAHEADPDAQLYYNDYRIERIGFKANKTVELVNWLRSQGATIHGIGLQYHILVSNPVTPGDDHYQSAQQFIDNNLDIMITELDIAMPVKDGKPVNPGDVKLQGDVYHELLEMALHFLPRCRAMLTWGFTDRYSWIPASSNYTAGDALPLDTSYQPKPAYLEMQEELARVITDGVYCLSPQSEPDKYLGTSDSGNVQLYSGECNNTNEKWNITWLGDGTYRLSPMSDNNSALYIFNATATVGEVQTTKWSDTSNQEWVFTLTGNNTYRVGPRNAWSRVMTVYEMTHIDVVDYSSSSAQNWILTSA